MYCNRTNVRLSCIVCSNVCTYVMMIVLDVTVEYSQLNYVHMAVEYSGMFSAVRFCSIEVCKK